MLKRIIATGMAMAFVVSLGACRQEPETAVIDDTFTTMPDTTPLGVPGGTLDPVTPGTVPPDTLGTVDPVTGMPTTPTP
jgi:hypothetical protein